MASLHVWVDVMVPPLGSLTVMGDGIDLPANVVLS